MLMLGDAGGLLQTRFVFARTFLPLWLPHEYYGWQNRNIHKISFRVKRIFKLSMVEDIWIVKIYHFISGVCIYLQYLSCRNILSPKSAVLHHKDSVFTYKASFFTSELIK